MARVLKAPTREMSNAGVLTVAFYDKHQDVYICEVDTSRVKADQTYQRPHDKRHSATLGKELAVFPYPILSLRAGVLWAVDGQHRTHGKKGRGYFKVKLGLTQQQEADLYNALNYQKRPNAWNRFKAGVMGGNADNVAICDMAREEEFTLACYNKGADLQNTTTLFEAYNADLLPEFFTVLKCFRDDHGRLHKNVRNGGQPFQRGVIDLLRKYGGEAIVRQPILNALRQIGVDLIVATAGEFCRCSRTERGHFFRAMEHLLQARNLLPQSMSRAA